MTLNQLVCRDVLCGTYSPDVVYAGKHIKFVGEFEEVDSWE